MSLFGTAAVQLVGGRQLRHSYHNCGTVAGSSKTHCPRRAYLELRDLLDCHLVEVLLDLCRGVVHLVCDGVVFGVESLRPKFNPIG